MAQASDHRHGDLFFLWARNNELMDSMEDSEAHRLAVGKRIALLRGKRSQTSLAADAGISQPSLSAIEAGDTKEITARTLLGLCAALHTTIEYVWHGSSQAKQRAIEEAELVALFRQLPPNGRMAVIQTVRTMHAAQASERIHPDERHGALADVEAERVRQEDALAQQAFEEGRQKIGKGRNIVGKPKTAKNRK